jgi:hypothetical protein
MPNPMPAPVTACPPQLSAYFSHSWSDGDLPVNLALWEGLSQRCHLLVDQPEPTAEAMRPYFISRIESVLRRADVFVGCVPSLPPQRQGPRIPDAAGDWRFNLCSPYILFELRLAERANLPRFVLYDRASRFHPPAASSPHVRYVGRHFEELRALIASGGSDESLRLELEQWLAWVGGNHAPRNCARTGRTAFLVGDDQAGAELQAAVIEAVDTGGFDRPEPLTSAFHTDAELYQTLRSLDLLVVDLACPEHGPLYHAAHSLMVPTVRVHSRCEPDQELADAALPTLLRGHPAGYQKDLVTGRAGAPFQARLEDRARAAARSALPVMGFEAGRHLLVARTYPKPHFVFLSHDEKLDNRMLVDAIIRECRHQSITVWEYAVENRSGEVWRQNLNNALAKTTHMLALLSPGYEQSPGCREEWDFALEHRLQLLPFLTHGRTRPSVELRQEKIAHAPLSDSVSPEESARRVVARLRETLLIS